MRAALYTTRPVDDHVDIQGIDADEVYVQNYKDLCGSYFHYDEATADAD
jgi:hypothetical protein